MRLEALELLEGRQVGVAVVEAGHEADGDLVRAEMVEERPAIGLPVERPADRVDDRALAVPGRIDLPELLDAEAEGLRADAVAQVEALEQLLGERAAHALREQGGPSMQLDARLVAGGPLAVLADAHVAGGDAADAAILGVQHLGRGEAREDLDAQRLGLLRQPAAHVAQADDVVAVVVHLRRRRQADGSLRGQEQEPVLARRRVERGALLAPVGDQLVEGARLHHRAGEDMGADLRALLEHADRELAAMLDGELPQADRGGQPGGPGTDDHDVVVHPIARHSIDPLLDPGEPVI